MAWRSVLAGGWRRFRRLPLWGQVVGGVVALAVVTAPFNDTDDGSQVVMQQPATAPGDAEDEPTTTSTTQATTTTVEVTTTTAPPTTAAPTPTSAPTTTAAPATTTTRKPVTTTTAKPATTTTKKPATQSSGCHTSYTRTCIPPDVSDADCAGGSGNGPFYVREKNIGVVGPDVFDLDRDGDGIGCES